MALKQEHIAMIGVGVAAIGTLIMMNYYRNSAASSQGASTGAAGAFPYFQTAALPSSVTSSGSSTGTGSTSSTGLDPNAILSALSGIAGAQSSAQSLAAQDQAAVANNQNMGTLANALIENLTGQLTASGGLTDSASGMPSSFAAGATAEQKAVQTYLNSQQGNSDAALRAQQIGLMPLPTDTAPAGGGGSQIIGSLNLPGFGTTGFNIIEDHPQSSDLAWQVPQLGNVAVGQTYNTPPLAFVNNPNSPVGGTSTGAGSPLPSLMQPVPHAA